MTAALRWLPVAVLFVVSGAFAAEAPSSAPPFPELSGPVVDQAGLLPAEARDALTQKLAAYDQASGNQLVVVTVPTLDGYPIEYWGYQLGRHWGIGQKGANTGALLIVDRDERAVRIEVGYGLEGTLTDALSDDIIRSTIVPKFKQGDYAGGISDGVDRILAVLGGQAEEEQQGQRRDYGSTLFLVLLVALFLIRPFFALFLFPRLGYRGYRGGWGGWGGGGFGGGGFGGGGFSGGGGSFGGGGASGRW